MSFIWPPMLAALMLVPLGVGLYLLIERRRRERLAAVGGLGLRTAEPIGLVRLRERIPAVLFLCAVTVFAVAVARPQAALSLPRSEGIVMLTFDVSGSMAADDLGASRLDVAKQIAKAFVDEQPEGVIIGVVAFSDAGLSVQSPSADTLEVQAAIDRLGPALGTSLGQGILASLEAIDRVEAGTPVEYYSNREPEPTASPEPVEPGSHAAAVVVLLTDGENTVPPDPVDAAGVAADQGIRIHTIGIGTIEGTTLETEGFSVHTQLDEALLQYVAEVTDGTYFELAVETDDFGEIAGSVDPAGVYETLGRQLDTRPEPTEVTSLFAGAGVLLLLAGAAASLAINGRLL